MWVRILKWLKHQKAVICTKPRPGRIHCDLALKQYLMSNNIFPEKDSYGHYLSYASAETPKNILAGNRINIASTKAK